MYIWDFLFIYMLSQMQSLPNIAFIWSSDFEKTQIHHYFKKLFLRYGPAVRIKFPGQPTMVILKNPEDIKTILQVTMTNPYREPIGCIRKIRYKDDYYEKKGGLVAE